MSVQTNLRSALEQLLGSIQNGIGSIASSTVLCRHAAVEALAGTTKYGCDEHEDIVGREQPASLHADMAESGRSRAVARSHASWRRNGRLKSQNRIPASRPRGLHGNG